MQKKKILVIGSTNLDFIINMKKIPVPGETVMGDSLEIAFGGKGANQAYACGNLGGDIVFLCAVGSEKESDQMLSSLSKAGVDITHVLVNKEQPTGRAYIYVNEQGNNCIVVVAGSNNLCTEEYIKQNHAILEQADIIMLQMEIPLSAVCYAVREANRLGKTVILNPAPMPDSFPEELLPLIDYLTPNETELEHVSGMAVRDIPSARKAAELLLKKGLKNVIVTLGKRGALLVGQNGSRHFPATDTPVVDTTAAGDTFNAGFAVYLSERRPVDSAITFANCAAGISVTRKGAQPSIPKRSEIDETQI